MNQHIVTCDNCDCKIDTNKNNYITEPARYGKPLYFCNQDYADILPCKKCDAMGRFIPF